MGYQSLIKVAPVVLLYIADFSKYGNKSKEEQLFYSAVNTGFISQNVYLYCAAEDLSTVVIGWVNWVKLEKVAKLLGIKNPKEVMLIQPIGYSK